MSNYTKTTDFSAKDDLPSGDPDKVVVGAEIDAEFDAIATAVATKANSADVPALSASNTFSGNSNAVSANPANWYWVDTGAAANQGRWRIGATAETFVFQARDDANSTGTSFLSASSRSGNTIGAVGITATTITLNGNAAISSTNPVLRLYDSDGAADTKYYSWEANAGGFGLYFRTDALGSGSIPISIARTGTGMTSCTLTTSTGTFTMSGITYSQSDGTTTGVLGFASTAFAFGTSSAHNATIQTNGTTRLTIRQDGSFVQQNLTVATLPAAGTAGVGARAFVTDANATTFASIVAGGGANKVPVYSDGTNWRIG